MSVQPANPTETSFCPLARSSKLVGDLWILMIINQLLEGPKRFCQLEDGINLNQELGNISTRTLSQRLKLLEEEKILTRKTYKEIPPHTEYALTEKGQALCDVLGELRKYGQTYLM